MRTPEAKKITERVTQQNIELIKKIEEEFNSHRSLGDFLGDSIGGVASNIAFVLVNLIFIVTWIAINSGYLLSIEAFDPYPFGLLSLVITSESVFLFMLVLIKQNRMTRRAEQRAHFALQLTMLVEQELTKVLQILEKLSESTGVSISADSQTKALSEETHLETLAQKLDEAFPED